MVQKIEIHYRPANEKIFALSDVQITLPLFQQEQAILLLNKNAVVHSHVQQATVEYQIMSAAAQILIEQPSRAVAPAIVNTIISHDSKCIRAMNSVAAVLQNQLERQLDLIFFVELTIESVLFIFLGGLLLFSHDPFVSEKLEKKAETMKLKFNTKNDL